MEDHVGRATDPLAAARDHRPEFYAAISGLELAAAAPAPRREQAWIADFGDALARLRDALTEHIAVTEGAGGLYEEIRREQPRLEHRTHELEDEHRSLVEQLDRTAAAATGEPGADVVEATRSATATLLASLFRHRQRGLDLVYEGYDTDLGAGG